MGEEAINKKISIIVVILIAVTVYLSYQYFESNPTLKEEILVNQIASTQMSKAAYSRETTPNIKFIDIELTNKQINNIAEWINSVPESSIIELNHIPSNISAGIVFRLKSNKEIRIQYDLEDIFITRTDIKNKQVMYLIEQDDLKNFFNKQLK